MVAEKSFGATVASLALLATTSVSAAASESGFPLHRYVDPMVGVGNDDEGDTIPGPAMPHGSIHPSPNTVVGSNAGYDRDAPISGFAQLHTQGSGGRTTYGTFLISPQVGEPEFDESRHLSPKRGEEARADRYTVILDRYQTRVEVAPAHHSAMYKFTYPEGSEGHLVFDVTRKIRGEIASAASEVRIDPEARTISGRVKAKGYWSPALIDIWFHAELDTNIRSWGVFKGGDRLAGTSLAAGAADERLGAWITFHPAPRPVQMKISVSFTSAERAAQLLRQELPNWDFEAVRAAAGRAWDRELGRIRIDATEADKRRFYTALYHTSIQPRDRTQDQAEADRGTPHWDDYYTLWDSYRTAFPLMSLLKPNAYGKNINSMLATFERYGAAETAFIGGRNYHVGQGGDEVDNVLGEGLLRDVPGVNWSDAARIALFNARQRRSARYLIQGYFAHGDRSPEPEHQRAKSGSSTLGFALNDFYASKLAAAAGLHGDAARLLERSSNWRNVWNTTQHSDGFAGFIQPRSPDGTFFPVDAKQGWDGKRHHNIGFYEGTSWIYSFGVLHDIPGMIEAMGGRQVFTARLGHALGTGLIDMSNEPSFATPWLFSEVDRPDLTSFWANEIYKQFTPMAYPGDEDNGAMSSHYVFNRLGLFPKLGSDLYYLHGPRQRLASIRLENGRALTVLAKNYGPGRIYMRSIRLNGRKLTKPFISQSDVMKGGVLQFVMSSSPGKRSWQSPLQVRKPHD
jgi:predicted alpha-1,2-mannosidase